MAIREMRLGQRFNNYADRLLTPMARKMGQYRSLGNLAMSASYNAGIMADYVGFKSWTMGSALRQAAVLDEFASYALMTESAKYESLAEHFMPASWQTGIFHGAWSTAEFVKWGYFAVALHVMVLTGLFFPEVANKMSGSVGGFAAEFGLSTAMAIAFTYGMIGGHHTSHVLEAAKSYNLERSVQETVGANLVQKLEDGSVKFRLGSLGFWNETAKIFFLAAAGKHPAVIKDGLNYRINGTPSDNVLAAGPRFDRYVSRAVGGVSLPVFALAIAARSGGHDLPGWLSMVLPKALSLSTISFLGKFQDSGALAAYEKKVKAAAVAEKERAAGRIHVDDTSGGVDTAARNNLLMLTGGARNGAVYGGTDPRFKDEPVFLFEGAHNAIQGGKHTEYVDASGLKGNTSPDMVAQEKWIILVPEKNDDEMKRGFFGTLQVLPILQNHITATILGAQGISGGGRENEGGCSINCYGGGDEAAIMLLMKAAAEAGQKNGYVYGRNLFLGLDNAADSNDMYNPETGLYKWQGRPRSGNEMVDRYVELFYRTGGNLLAFEDPFAAPESQWQFWGLLNERLGDKMLLIGDDILCTNPTIAYRALTQHAVNAGLVKLNQVGSFSQAWMYMELFHSAGRNTVMSHRSTQPDTPRDPMEITAALAASYRPASRVILGKLGGIYLANRASLYYRGQQAIEDWRAGRGVTDGMGPEVKIKTINVYPSPLGAGKYGLMAVMHLENGVVIESPIPGGLSRGESETRLLGPEAGAKVMKDVIEKLGLIGKPLGTIGNVFEIERMLMSFDIEEARRQGKLPQFSDETWDAHEEEAAFKRYVGGDVTLSLGQLFMKAVALRDGLPPWLVYRLHGKALNEQIGMSFDNYPAARRAFYEPIFTGQVGQGAFNK